MEKYVVRVSIFLTILLFLSGCGNDAGPVVKTQEDFIVEALGAPFEIAVAVVGIVGDPEWTGPLIYDAPTGVMVTADKVNSTKTVHATFTDYSDSYTGYTITGTLTMEITNPDVGIVGITLNGTLTFSGGGISGITFNDVQTDIIYGQPPTSATGTVTVDGTVYPANTIIELFSA